MNAFYYGCCRQTYISCNIHRKMDPLKHNYIYDENGKEVLETDTDKFYLHPSNRTEKEVQYTRHMEGYFRFGKQESIRFAHALYDNFLQFLPHNIFHVDKSGVYFRFKRILKHMGMIHLVMGVMRNYYDAERDYGPIEDWSQNDFLNAIRKCDPSPNNLGLWLASLYGKEKEIAEPVLPFLYNYHNVSSEQQTYNITKSRWEKKVEEIKSTLTPEVKEKELTFIGKKNV